MLQRILTLLFLLLSLSFTATAKTFITDICKSDNDCTSGCCGFKSGKCAGPVIAQERDGGCGFGNAQPNANAAVAFRAGMAAQNSNNAAGTTMVVSTPTPSSSAAAPKKKTFITDVCKSDDDCASGCCGFRSGKCAGPIIAQSRDGGCGFGNASPNADAARALGFKGQPGQAPARLGRRLILDVADGV